MGKIGFWQLLLDDKMSWWEAQRINDANSAAEVAQGIADSAHFRAQSLEHRVAAMGREIIMLRTAVTVLTQTLKDSKVLDERLLDARLDAAMEEAQAALTPKPAPSFAAGKHPVPVVTSSITCITCRKSVLANTTLMTADGPVCERCPV